MKKFIEEKDFFFFRDKAIYMMAVLVMLHCNNFCLSLLHSIIVTQ